MNFWTSLLVSLLLLLVAIGLMLSHLHAWRRVRRRKSSADDDTETKLEAEEFDYRRRQFRRRMQTSTMLGLLAVAILVGQWLESQTGSPLWELAFWGFVLLLVVWICLLALVDAWATSYHFGRIRQNHTMEQARLQAQVRRAQSARGNGRAKKTELPGSQRGE